MSKKGIILGMAVFLLAVGYCFVASAEAATEVIKVQSHKVPVRKGPGWYYEVVAQAGRGDTLELIEKSGRWYKVKLASGTVGYASVRSIGNASSSGKGRGGSKGLRGGTSRPMMVAALRGVADMGLFPRKYAEKHGLDPAEFESLMQSPFGGDEFKGFRRPLRKYSASFDALEGADIPASDLDVGAAVAMRVLEMMPPSSDHRLWKYVSLVGATVQERTPLYDVPFVFIVLESPKVNSFSAPGGFVFITTGALDIIKNEAELAGVLSHEMIHVIERHGMKELDKQSLRLKSSDMMDDLDSELETRGLDKGDEKVQADLEDMADQMFEQLIGGRKMQDEDHADHIGTILLRATGYSSAGLKNFIAKTATKVTGSETKTYAYRDAGRRADAITRLISKEGLTGGVELADRFGNHTH